MMSHLQHNRKKIKWKCKSSSSISYLYPSPKNSEKINMNTTACTDIYKLIKKLFFSMSPFFNRILVIIIVLVLQYTAIIIINNNYNKIL